MSRGFLAAGVQERVRALADDASPFAIPGAEGASAVAVGGRIAGRPVVIVATNPVHASGAIGRADVAVFIAAIRHARDQGVPLVFVLDSAGAHLSEGVGVLGAFRRLQRELLEAVIAGTPLAVVLGQNCFGGASLLAYAAELRVCPRGSRLGLSGPKALSALLPGTYSREDISALVSCESRARFDEDALLVTDDTEAVRSVLATWLAQRRAPENAMARSRTVLTRRLKMYRGDPTTLSTAPPPPELEARLDYLFGGGWSACYSDAVVWGDGWADGRNTNFAGFVSGKPVDAFACWRLLEVLREFSREPEAVPVTLLLDAPGQAADPHNEQIVLSEFVARVAEALVRLHTRGCTIELWLVGEAGGAIYVALAAAANTITAWPGVKLQTLPSAAVNSVVGEQPRPKPSISALFEARVIDRWTRAPGFAVWPGDPLSSPPPDAPLA